VGQQLAEQTRGAWCAKNKLYSCGIIALDMRRASVITRCSAAEGATTLFIQAEAHVFRVRRLILQQQNKLISHVATNDILSNMGNRRSKRATLSLFLNHMTAVSRKYKNNRIYYTHMQHSSRRVYKAEHFITR
jgi:hypothetical protein